MTPAHIIHNDKVERAERLGAEWRAHAACVEYGPDLFYPVSGHGKPAPDFETPLAVCRRCPVLDDCYRWATTAGEVKGGYTVRDIGHVVAGCRPKAKGEDERKKPVEPLRAGKRECGQCGVLFTARAKQVYCSMTCSQTSYATAKRVWRAS